MLVERLRKESQADDLEVVKPEGCASIGLCVMTRLVLKEAERGVLMNKEKFLLPFPERLIGLVY